VLSSGRQHGFSLIEALVTVSVLGLLLAAVMPSVSDWIRATNVRNIAESTQAGLQKARNEALKRNKVVTFWLVSPPTTSSPDASCALSSTSGAWVISLDNPAGKCDVAPSLGDEPRIIETYGPGKGALEVMVKAVDAAGADATSVSFNGFGQRVGGGVAQIDITHGAGPTVRPLRIQVSVSGGIRMCDPAVASPDTRACN
jgi:type IV fimbrial biogenesis protein FimT